MLIGLLKTLLIINNIFLILIVLVQQSKGGMGLGSLGGSSQLLFGGSGGQDLLQKITWFLGSIFMLGSLILSLMASRPYNSYPQAGIIPSQTATAKKVPPTNIKNDLMRDNAKAPIQ